jgi:hypothetical protein
LDQVHEQNNRKLVELFHQRERAWQEEQWVADEQKIQNDLRLITLHAEQERQWQREQEEADELEYQNNLKLTRLHAERERAWQANQKSMWDRIKSAWQDTIQPEAMARMPILNNALTAADQAAPGGPQAMAVAVLTSLLVDSTQFAELLERINPLLQAGADVIGAFFEPIMPLITVLSSALTPALSVFAHVVGSMGLPVMQALFPVFKGLGLVALGVTIAFGHAWNLLASVINAALGWLGVNLKLIDTGELGEAFEALKNMTWEQAAATEAATNAMYNVPHGFKIALRRFEAATAEPWSPGGTSGSRSAGASQAASVAREGARGLNVYLTFSGPVYGMDHFEDVVVQAVDRANGRAQRTRYGFAGAGA